MTETERIDRLEAAILKLTEQKPTAFCAFWRGCQEGFLLGAYWIMPYTIAFLLGVFSCTLVNEYKRPQVTKNEQQTLEQQAALGGAAIPFPSGSPSPWLLTTPPKDLPAESTAHWWMSTFEPPSQANPQADNGQTNSQESFRRTQQRRR